MGVAAGVRRPAPAHAGAARPARRGRQARGSVDDAEILDLQNRGSARLTSYRRARDTETYIGADANVRRWRESSLGTTIAWIVVVVGIVVASRTMIDTTVPTVGEFLPLPDSARELVERLHVGVEPRRARRIGGQPDRLGACCRSPACCGCSGWASG